MGVDFMRRSVELVQQYRRPGQRIQYTFQTNGVLLEEAAYVAHSAVESLLAARKAAAVSNAGDRGGRRAHQRPRSPDYRGPDSSSVRAPGRPSGLIAMPVTVVLCPVNV